MSNASDKLSAALNIESTPSWSSCRASLVHIYTKSSRLTPFMEKSQGEGHENEYAMLQPLFKGDSVS